jgi:hypothetical protein
MRFAALVLVPSLVLVAGGGSQKKQSHRGGPVSTAKAAKEIAERETGGTALTARRVPLNGASGGWEVEVRMPKEERGWRCVIDADSHSVYTKDRIPNPKAPSRRR